MVETLVMAELCYKQSTDGLITKAPVSEVVMLPTPNDEVLSGFNAIAQIEAGKEAEKPTCRY